jgi:hypothetical protein
LENLKGRDRSEDTDIDGRVMLGVGSCGLDESGSGEGPVALVNMVMNLCVP